MHGMHRLCLCLLFVGLANAASVQTERVPERGVQPQVVAGGDGTLHLVFLKGAASGADVRYATRKKSESSWGPAITVNSDANTAVAMGTIRGAQIALGKDGSVHVVWNGPGGKDKPSALFYTRKEAGKATFEPQRNLRADTKGLDGGASIAASAKGEVFIIWHGARENMEPGEKNRVVFVLKSADNGASFSKLQAANLDDTGVCACCSLKSFMTPNGELITLYRAARRMDQRDVTLLTSKDGGATFQHRIVGPWAISACPMSSMSIVNQGKQTRGAWETDGKVFTALLDGTSEAVNVSDKNTRHPSLAMNNKGETLVSWSIGTGWQKGGSLGWKTLDANGRPTNQQGRADGVPVWGFTAAYPQGDGFVVMY